MNYSGMDDFTGEPYSFELLDVQQDVIDNNPCITAKIETSLGHCSVLEWLNTDFVERIDSHMKIHDIGNLENLFNLEKKPDFMPIEDFLPFKAIFDALDQELSSLSVSS